MDIRKRIGLVIKSIRTENRLTQAGLAAKSCLDKSYINEIENGKRNISIVNLEKIIIALNLDLARFFSKKNFGEQSSPDEVSTNA